MWVWEGVVFFLSVGRSEKRGEGAMNLWYIPMYHVNIHTYIKRLSTTLLNKVENFESNKPNSNLTRLKVDLIGPNKPNSTTLIHPVSRPSLFEFGWPTIQTFTMIQQYKAADTSQTNNYNWGRKLSLKLSKNTYLNQWILRNKL